MKTKEILSWTDVKNRYKEFHKIDNFTEAMSIDIDFGYWLVNEVSKSIPCPECNGDGWYADHAPNCRNGMGECEGDTCPIQVECEECRGTGKIPQKKQTTNPQHENT